MEDNIAKEEKEKYSEIWAKTNYRSNRDIQFANVVNGLCNDRVLELGCGALKLPILLKPSIHYTGVDITLAHITEDNKYRAWVYEGAAWDIGKLGQLFDYTVSNDFLEHIPPEMVKATVQAIVDVSTKGCVHAICFRPAVKDYYGHKVHLSVHTKQWWIDLFEECRGDKDLNIVILNSDKI